MMTTINNEYKENFDFIIRNFREIGFCRICMVVKKRMVRLDSRIDSEMLFQVFTSVTGIDTSSNDQLPQQICLHCKTILLKYNLFRKKCEQSDSILKTVFNIIKKEPVDNGGSNNSEFSLGDEDIECYDDIKVEEEKFVREIPKLEPRLHSIRSLTLTQQQQHSEPSSTNSDTKDIINEEIKTGKDSKNNDEPQSLLISPKEDKQYMQERKLHSCTVCEQNFRSAKSLKIHIKVNHTAEAVFFCSQCQESYDCEKDLKLHAVLHDEGPPWTCTRCDKQFLVKYKFRRHILRHMDSKQHKCDKCDKAFSEHYSLVRHQRSHSTIPERNYECHLCDKRYTSQSGLAAHTHSHNRSRLCVCAVCGRAFPSARLLHSHTRTHSDTKPYSCDTCHKAFRHSSTLRAHTRTHTGEKPYVCACCGITFRQRSNMATHMRTHTGEKPHKCSKCDRHFTSRSSLTLHERRHNGYKPRVCNICGKRFVGSDILVHLRRHAGSRPHACLVCPLRFYTATTLKDHARIHTGIKPFECALCQKKMTTKSSLVKHLKAHETKKLKEEQLAKDKIDVIPYICTEEVTAQDTNIIVESQDTIILTIEGEFPKDLEGKKQECLEENAINCDNLHASVNLVGGNVGLATATVNSEGFNVIKLYQVDQSLLHISSGDQVTISKITDAVTADFE